MTPSESTYERRTDEYGTVWNGIYSGPMHGFNKSGRNNQGQWTKDPLSLLEKYPNSATEPTIQNMRSYLREFHPEFGKSDRYICYGTVLMREYAGRVANLTATLNNSFMSFSFGDLNDEVEFASYSGNPVTFMAVDGDLVEQSKEFLLERCRVKSDIEQQCERTKRLVEFWQSDYWIAKAAMLGRTYSNDLGVPRPKLHSPNIILKLIPRKDGGQPIVTLDRFPGLKSLRPTIPNVDISNYGGRI